ncbi:GNAT family N-acetyltransferase [Citreimonas salinaria]|uniref:L-ornithine N(alpha)-acyltransferase n=1 Tax=Citreimonas salinaria TaxID=321339 RepID=A0A1H3KQG3_9RHOB|nr:GNAT family N-acyltransferase [Citreimonas salinaria]SDY54008.1 ornithine-acyl[acyl carrier protein] N-acyltransferase [Citreimonas salinaria]
MTGLEGLDRGLVLGRYRVRAGQGVDDLAAARALRAIAFARAAGHDDDPHDARCTHVLVEDIDREETVACFRMADLDADAIETSYAAGFYDLSQLAARGGRLLELGRFCLRPGRGDPDILRLAWGALAMHVDAAGTGLMFGCASFAGADPARHRPALALLARQHLGPPALRPGPRAPDRVTLDAEAAPPAAPGRPSTEGLRAMPPLLRTYLAMGGWVGDHAVIDHDMDTLHVFTAVEVAAIPPARARSIRAVAARTAPA